MIWKKAVEPCQTLRAPEESGWHYEEDILKPQLITQEQVSAACLQLAFVVALAKGIVAQAGGALVFVYHCAALMPANVGTFAQKH